MTILKHFTRGFSFLIDLFRAGVNKTANLIVTKTKFNKSHADVVKTLNTVAVVAVVAMVILAPVMVLEIIQGLIVGSLIGGMITIVYDLCSGVDSVAV